MENPGNVVYRFADFRLEPRERRLTGSGGAIALTPKVFDTLVLLVTKSGRVLSKDELMKALRPRGFVDEATLSNQVWQLRRALGDTSKAHRIIETVPKTGYRFAAPVVVESVSNADAAAGPTPLPAEVTETPEPAASEPASTASPCAAPSELPAAPQSPSARRRIPLLGMTILGSVLVAAAVLAVVT